MECAALFCGESRVLKSWSDSSVKTKMGKEIRIQFFKIKNFALYILSVLSYTRKHEILALILRSYNFFLLHITNYMFPDFMEPQTCEFRIWIRSFYFEGYLKIVKKLNSGKL